MVGELIFVDQRVSQCHDPLQVVQPEGIGGPQRRDDGGDLFPARQCGPRGLFELDKVDFVFVRSRNGDQIAGPDAEPPHNVHRAVVSGVGNEDDGVFRDALLHGSRAGLFQTEFHPVERCSRCRAEGKHAAGKCRVVPDQLGSDGGGLDFAPAPPGGCIQSQETLGLCNAESRTPMTLGIVGGGTTFCWVRG